MGQQDGRRRGPINGIRRRTWTMPSSLMVALAASLPVLGQEQDDGGRLGLADLPAYRAALNPRRSSDEPPAFTSHRDLWENPERFTGRRVTVGGRIVRMFHQGSVGEFPALVELWLSTPEGDLFCATCPEPSKREGEPLPKVGQNVVFTGTFFRKIGYSARDGMRFAPLVVGSAPPVQEVKEEAVAEPTLPPRSAWTLLGSWIVLAVSVAICLAAWRIRAAAWSHRKSRTRGDVDPDPPIQFLRAGETSEECAGPDA